MTERTAERVRLDLQARHGLIDGEECVLRGRDPDEAHRACRVFIQGAPRLRFWVVDLDPREPDGEVPGSRRLLTDGERERLVPAQ